MIAIDQIEFKQFHLARHDEPRPVVVDLGRLCGEMRQFHAIIHDRLLQSRANVMLSGVDRDGEPGIAAVSTRPDAVNCKFCSWVCKRKDVNRSGVMNKVDPSFARRNWGRCLGLIVQCNFETDVP